MSKEQPIVAACPNCKRLHNDLDGPAADLLLWRGGWLKRSKKVLP